MSVQVTVYPVYSIQWIQTSQLSQVKAHSRKIQCIDQINDNYSRFSLKVSLITMHSLPLTEEVDTSTEVLLRLSPSLSRPVFFTS